MNINYYNPYVRYELYHHGIFGMRWGKRNGPPYPLAASAHSASEKKAGWRKSLDSAKSEYKERKRSYKAASKEYRKAKKEYKVAKQDLKYAKDDRKVAKAGYKESKAGVKEARMDARGGSLGVKEAKQARKDSKYEFDRAKFNEGKMRDTLKTKMSDLKTAKDKLKAEKILLREGKKLLRDAQDEAKIGKMYERNIAKGEGQFNPENAKRDAWSDVNRMIGGSLLTKTPDGQNLNSARDKDFMKRMPYAYADSLATSSLKRDGGSRASEAYAKEYSKQYDAAIDKIRKGYKLSAEGKRNLSIAEAKKPSFRTENGDASESRLASRVKQMQSSGKTYAQIADALNISEGSVGRLLNGKYR